MSIGKIHLIALLLVFLILVSTVCLPVRAASTTVQNVAVTKLTDEPSYKETLFVITTNQTTYHIIVGANITAAGNETLIQLKATLYNPENETVLASAAIPDTLYDHPTINGAPAIVQAIHIHFPEWVVEDLVYLILPVATIVAIIAEVFYIVYEIAEAPWSYLFNEIINEVPLVWASIPWVFREILITDSNNDDTGKQGIEPSDYYHLGSFDLYVPISVWNLWNALVHDDYYIRTKANWWEIEQKEYYVWIIPLFKYFIAQKISSGNPTPPVASFTYSPSQPVVGEQIVFISTSYATTPGGYVASQTWSLGDNTSETSANFTHIYQHSGIYIVIINVTDNNNLTNSTSETVSVQPAPRVQMRVVPDELSLEVQQGQNMTTQFLVEETLNQSDLLGVNFAASDLSETFGNQTISSGNVTFNMNDITVTKGTYTNITTTFNAPLSSSIDWYSGNITATSANGGSKTIFVDVFVYCPPAANFTWSPLTPYVRQGVTFDASSSISGGGPIVGYQWNFGDGNTTDTTTPITYHAFNSSGSYLVTLNVTDSNNLWNTTQQQLHVIRHDVAIEGVVPDSDWVYRGSLCHAGVNVTVENLGEVPENFTVTLYAFNDTATPANLTVGTQQVTDLIPNLTLVLRFIWNSSDAQPCHWYNITAVASTVQGETDTENNVNSSLILVKVKLFADVNGDGKVDIADVALAATAFGESKGDPRWLPWGPYADMDSNGKIDLKDIALIAKNFGKTC